jgi:hypothetical protein
VLIKSSREIDKPYLNGELAAFREGCEGESGFPAGGYIPFQLRDDSNKILTA